MNYHKKIKIVIIIANTIKEATMLRLLLNRKILMT
jgi:hypothetical protein